MMKKQIPTGRRLTNLTFAVAVFATMSILLTGCVGNPLKRQTEPAVPEVVVPDLPTAREQYGYAVKYQQNLFIPGEKAKRDIELNKAIQVYQRVLINFPDDTEFTPRAGFAIAEARYRQDRFDEANSIYTELEQRYPTFDTLIAQCMMRRAQILDISHRPAEAKIIYKQIMDRFHENKERTISAVVARAQRLYYAVREVDSGPSAREARRDGNQTPPRSR